VGPSTSRTRTANVLDAAVLLERVDRPASQDAAGTFDFSEDRGLDILAVVTLLEAV